MVDTVDGAFESKRLKALIEDLIGENTEGSREQEVTSGHQ